MFFVFLYLRSIAVFSLQQLGELAVEGREEMLNLAAGILVELPDVLRSCAVSDDVAGAACNLALVVASL